MSHRVAATVTAALFLVVIGLISPVPLLAQSKGPVRQSVAAQLTLLSRERQRYWASTRPVIHCVPAPLTERPTAAAEFARPQVLPLEATFLDAAVVKSNFAALASRAAPVRSN